MNISKTQTVKEKTNKTKNNNYMSIEVAVNQKKAYEIFTDSTTYDENNYDSEKESDPLVRFDEEINFKKDVKGVDICFLLDSSGIMKPYMRGSKVIIRGIVRDAIRCITQFKVLNDDMLRIALVCYRDNEDKSQDTFTFDFTNEHYKFKEILKSVNAKGDSKECEAILDGLNQVVNNLTWRNNSEKILFHFMNAPTSNSLIESKNNGVDLESIMIQMREMEIDYTVVQLNESTNKIIEKLSEYVEIDVLKINVETDKK